MRAESNVEGGHRLMPTTPDDAKELIEVVKQTTGYLDLEDADLIAILKSKETG
jgi:hypothetical protein